MFAIMVVMLFKFAYEQMGVEFGGCLISRCLRYFCVFGNLASIRSSSNYSMGNLLPEHDSGRNWS